MYLKTNLKRTRDLPEYQTTAWLRAVAVYEELRPAAYDLR